MRDTVCVSLLCASYTKLPQSLTNGTNLALESFVAARKGGGYADKL